MVSTQFDPLALVFFHVSLALALGSVCFAFANCSMIMELEEQWENEEPQKMLSNGKEIITTRSTLLCRACGGEIRAVTSGQDGVEAARIAKEIELVREMEVKYPGLLDILGNPYGSLYLEEGIYQMALQFLEERVDKNGGDIWILGLYSEEGLENTLIRSCLEQLLTVSGVERESSVIEKLNLMGFNNGKEPGWDVHSLNKEMIGMLNQRCEDTAEKIKNNKFYRWKEENKQHLDWYTGKLTELAYLSLIYYWSMNLGQPKEYKQEAEAENAKKLKETEEKVGKSETEVTVEGEGGSAAVQSKLNKLLKSDYYKTDLGYDCSEIAQDFYDAAGQNGKIYRIEGKSGYTNGYEYNNQVEYIYHEVYSDGTYIYDPRYTDVPVLKDDYFRPLINDF